MLSGEHITVRYGNCAVVDDLSFRLDEGEWLMLAGPNGAGKSTLIEAIAQGVPYTGAIRWEKEDIRNLKGSRLARRIGVLSQKNNVSYAYTVEEVVGLGRYAYKNGLFSGRDDGGRETLRAFHDALCEEYAAVLYGDTAFCHRMKEVWSYLILRFAGGDKHFKRIAKAKTKAELQSGAAAVFAELPLLPEARLPGGFSASLG